MKRFQRRGKANTGLLVVLGIVAVIAIGYYLWSWSSSGAEESERQRDLRNAGITAPPPAEDPNKGIVGG